MDEGGGGGTFHLIVFFFLMVKSGAFHCFKPDSHFAKYQKKSRALILQKLEVTFLLHLRRILIFFLLSIIHWHQSVSVSSERACLSGKQFNVPPIPLDETVFFPHLLLDSFLGFSFLYFLFLRGSTYP